MNPPTLQGKQKTQQPLSNEAGAASVAAGPLDRTWRPSPSCSKSRTKTRTRGTKRRSGSKWSFATICSTTSNIAHYFTSTSTNILDWGCGTRTRNIKAQYRKYVNYVADRKEAASKAAQDALKNALIKKYKASTA
ncbi:MAG: hypothetical protein LQ348_004961 [Seirophora lacunosa]|nr:MAG: hypothetical protein LQ348_004961 [Seirophora lacunosa]